MACAHRDHVPGQLTIDGGEDTTCGNCGATVRGTDGEASGGATAPTSDDDFLVARHNLPA